MRNKRFASVIMMVALLLVAAGCENKGSGNSEGGNATSNSKGGTPSQVNTETIEIGMNNWAENIAISNMWEQILEKRGFNVELVVSQKGTVWTGIAEGELDLSPEVWLPYTDKPYIKEYKEEVVVGEEPWYKKTGLGLVVPTYVKIDSITDLNAHKQKFDSKIVGIDPGASLMDLTRKALKKYDLQYKLIESSGPGMMSALKKAYDNKEPIVVTLWNPHFAFARYDLKYLKDPKKVYGEGDDIYYMTREGFADDYPKVKKWFDNWKMSHKQLADLMAAINDAGDPKKGAANWIEKNQDLIKTWTPEK